MNPFKKRYSTKEKEQFAFLRTISLFNRLHEEELHLFLPFLYVRNYKANEAVFFRNDPSQALYIVRSGRVSLQLDREDRFELLVNIEANQAFGDNALLEESYRIYNALVDSENAELLVLPKENILGIFESYPKVKAKMMENLAEQYNRYTYNLFDAYKASFGFFELSQAYNEGRSEDIK